MQEYLWNRRTFLRNVALATLAISIPTGFRRRKKWTLLHTNDFHSRLDPFPPEHPKFAGKGGIAGLAKWIEKEKSLQEVLLVDCGDIVQGTPYFNFFEGLPELEWMNRIGYHCATLGNHDFDKGVEHLKKWMKWAHFPFVSCNYEWENPQPSDPTQLKKYHIHQIGHHKIGITGIGIKPQGLIPDHLFKGMVYHENGVERLQETVNTLRKKERCQTVIVLSHLGFEYKDQTLSDKILAQQTYGIDHILGGHTHTFLDQPFKTKNSKGKKVYINQAGWAGLSLGKIVLSI